MFSLLRCSVSFYPEIKKIIRGTFLFAIILHEDGLSPQHESHTGQVDALHVRKRRADLVSFISSHILGHYTLLVHFQWSCPCVSDLCQSFLLVIKTPLSFTSICSG